MNTMVRENLPFSFLSFDIEALPGRAPADHVERLVWGRIGDGEFGLRRLCNILWQHRIRGNFLIDFSMCVLYGDQVVREIVDYLMEQGHEIHAHLHSEWLVRRWGINGDWSGPLGMDRLGPFLNDAFLQYTAFKYWKLTGSTPQVFRAGSCLFSQDTVAAASRAGFIGLSNFNRERHEGTWRMSAESAADEPFLWPEGIVELPMDIAPEPLSYPWEKYLSGFERVRIRKRTRTFNLILHSTSLLQRQASGHFENFNPEHEENLHRICEHLAANTVSQGYAEYLSQRHAFPVLREAACLSRPVQVTSPLLRCQLCSCLFGSTLQAGCPVCGTQGASIPYVAGIASQTASQNGLVLT